MRLGGVPANQDTTIRVPSLDLGFAWALTSFILGRLNAGDQRSSSKGDTTSKGNALFSEPNELHHCSESMKAA